MRKRNCGISSTSSQSWCRRKIRTAFIVLCLMPWLTSCATTDPQIVVRYQRIPVPQSLLLRCPKSDLPANTYEGAIIGFKERGKDLDECNARLDDIRKWNDAP